MAYPFHPPPFQPVMAPPMFAPRITQTLAAAASTSQASTSQRAPPQPQNMLQVSANKAMLDAQKAMAMQTKEPPVMGPQITPKSLEDKELSNKAKKNIKYVRTAGGEVWEDSSLEEWDPNDFRIFCGDLGNEVNDEALARAFKKYPSFQKAKIIRDKKSNKSKGYGFVSFKDPNDFVRAMKEMNGKYVGNRPIKLRKSQWKERQLNVAKKRVREKQRLGMRTWTNQSINQSIGSSFFLQFLHFPRRVSIVRLFSLHLVMMECFSYRLVVVFRIVEDEKADWRG